MKPVKAERDAGGDRKKKTVKIVRANGKIF